MDDVRRTAEERAKRPKTAPVVESIRAIGLVLLHQSKTLARIF